MKHINKFLDFNLIDAEIKRLDDLLQDLKRQNAMYRTRLRRLKKVRDSASFDDESIVREGEC